MSEPLFTAEMRDGRMMLRMENGRSTLTLGSFVEEFAQTFVDDRLIFVNERSNEPDVQLLSSHLK